MVKTEVSARVSSWLFFLNRGGLIGKRGNIPSGERVAGWRKWGGHTRASLRAQRSNPGVYLRTHFWIASLRSQ
jgi:hypothetical protein